jgi:hypothetical protein
VYSHRSYCQHRRRGGAIFTYRNYSARERDIIVSRGKATLLAKRDNYLSAKGRGYCKHREGNIVSQRGNIVRRGWVILSAKGGEYCLQPRERNIVSQGRGILSAKGGDH